MKKQSSEETYNDISDFERKYLPRTYQNKLEKGEDDENKVITELMKTIKAEIPKLKN
ncbi:MAG: hypothetical protein ACTSW4_00275 [Candidatus Ranarchaeia archaeon]